MSTYSFIWAFWMLRLNSFWYYTISVSSSLTSFIRSLWSWYSWILTHSSANSYIFSLVHWKIMICSSSFRTPSWPESKTSKNSCGVVSLVRSKMWSRHFSKTSLMFASFSNPSFLKSALRMACQISLHLRAPPISGFDSLISFWRLCLGMLASDENVLVIPPDYIPLALSSPVTVPPVTFVLSTDELSALPLNGFIFQTNLFQLTET